MKEEELKDLLRLLSEAGVKAEMCDKPVPVSGSSAICGYPTEPGDYDLSDYVLLPKELMGIHPEMFVPVEGESMLDAGYEPGDQLRIRFGVTPHDNEDVLAWIDGRCTVKTLFTDEDGQKWLVPRNEEYDAIMLTEEMDVRILGVVLSVEKPSSRASSRGLLQSIRRTKNKMKAAKKLTVEEVDERIVKIGPMVVHARQWFSVYRALLDKTLTEENDFLSFCNRVKRLLPDHEHLPDPKELSKMNVLSFTKPLSMWVESNAPVKGQRFRDYLRIGMTMSNLLSE